MYNVAVYIMMDIMSWLLWITEFVTFKTMHWCQSVYETTSIATKSQKKNDYLCGTRASHAVWNGPTRSKGQSLIYMCGFSFHSNDVPPVSDQPLPPPCITEMESAW